MLRSFLKGNLSHPTRWEQKVVCFARALHWLCAIARSRHALLKVDVDRASSQTTAVAPPASPVV